MVSFLLPAISVTVGECASDNAIKELRRTVYHKAVFTHDLRRPSTITELPLRLGP
jgi:hypothetical protein